MHPQVARKREKSEPGINRALRDGPADEFFREIEFVRHSMICPS